MANEPLVFLNEEEERQYEIKKRRESLSNQEEGRGSLLPFKKDEEGIHLAVPQFLRDVANSVTLPSDVAQGYEFDQDDIMNFATEWGLSGLAVGAATSPIADVGMFLGPKAKNADLRQLTQAMSMEAQGRNREEIWSSTGWFKGPDKKWRFEIDDSQADLVPAVQDLQQQQSNMSDPDQLDAPVSVVGPLTSIYNHPTVFDNYPDLSKVEAEMVALDPYQKSYGGWHTPAHTAWRGKTGFIQPEFIKAESSYPDYQKSIFAHEIQHAIQNREGFESGTNPIMADELSRQLREALPPSYWEWRVAQDEGIGIEQDMNEKLSLLEEATKIMEDPSTDLFTQAIKEEEVEELTSTIKVGIDKYNDIRDRESKAWKDLEPYHDDILKLQTLIEGDNMEGYQAKAGEAEARLVQKRLHLSAEERKVFPPWEDYEKQGHLPPDRKKSKNIENPEDQSWTLEGVEDFIRRLRAGKETNPFINTTVESRMVAPSSRETKIEVDEFKKLLQNKKIRPASLDDVEGTHHKRKLYKHPNTNQWYVEVK